MLFVISYSDIDQQMSIGSQSCSSPLPGIVRLVQGFNGFKVILFQPFALRAKADFI